MTPETDLSAILKDFVVESRENLDQLERDLIALESDPSSGATLGSIFRTVHTIKGASGFMGLAKLETLAHSGESVLSRLRDGALVISPSITSGLLAMSDCMRHMLAHLDQTGEEGDRDVIPIIEQLTRLQDGAAAHDREPVDAHPVDNINHVDNINNINNVNVESHRQTHTGSHIRVSVEQLDKLMNLVGELVLARNEIVQLSSGQKSPQLIGTSQRLNSITTQLQQGIMKTRMQPIDNVWRKLSRVVRDAAQQCGKQVRLEMEGKETELDRTLIEAIHDPLTHAVRNCIDHGLEAPARRTAAGKPAEGRLLLRAFHQGGQVTIEVSDDGVGIDTAATKRKALERGLITKEQARGMSEQDAMNLIFLPGLSTAAKVTSLSGRGVGMDVVKTNIERIGGKVSVQSEIGAGTTVRMRIPLTLAIMSALVVSNGSDCYAIPQVNAIELVRLEGENAGSRIEMICDVPVYRLRGELLPLVWLAAELAPQRQSRFAGRPSGRDVVNIVVLQADNLKFGLIVDDVNDTQEIVVKPLGRHVRVIPIFAGATIMGDGKVVLILDVPALAVHANVLTEVRDQRSLRSEISTQHAHQRKESLLLLAGLDDSRMAIPVAQLTRLEEFPRASVERAGDRDVVQYFGDILPLADIEGLLQRRGAGLHDRLSSDTETLQALVYSKNGRRIGVVVGRILDTIEQSLGDVRPVSRHGVIGSVVIDGRVTEILDLDAICAGVLETPGSSDRFAGAEA